MELKIKVITKEEFAKIVRNLIVEDKKDWPFEQVIEWLLDEGFPKLDFERLDDSLKQIFVYIDNVAVDFGDSKFVWMVSGNRAILIAKN